MDVYVKELSVWNLLCVVSLFILPSMSDMRNTSCGQYIHGLAARGVHYIHRPGPVLQDVGFYLLPVSIKIFHPLIHNYFIFNIYVYFDCILNVGTWT